MISIRSSSPCSGDNHTMYGQLGNQGTRAYGNASHQANWEKKNVPPAPCPVSDNPLYWVKYRKRKHCHFPQSIYGLWFSWAMSYFFLVKDLSVFFFLNLSYHALNTRKFLVSIKSYTKEFHGLSDFPHILGEISDQWSWGLFCDIWPWANTTIFPTS